MRKMASMTLLVVGACIGVVYGDTEVNIYRESAYTAILSKDDEGLLSAIKRININEPLDDHGRMALHTAIIMSDVDTAALLIDHGALVNAYDRRGMTPLHYASSMGVFGMVELLLSKGGNPNLGNSVGRTPLHCALMQASSGFGKGDPRFDYFRTIRSLLIHGADRDRKDDDGHTAEVIASKGKLSRDISKLLGDRGQVTK